MAVCGMDVLQIPLGRDNLAPFFDRGSRAMGASDKLCQLELRS